MDNNNGMIGMALGSWLVALASGVLAAVLLMLLGGWGFMQGVFAGVVVFVVFGAIISWIMTRPLPVPGELSLGTPAAAPEAKPAPAAAPAPTASADAPKVQPSKRLPGQDELAARKGEWTYEKEPAKEAPKPAAAAQTGATGERPAGLTDAARDGGADDLKKISGVGPKLEETLNSLGIWHFDQVASLTKDDIAWVDERLRFKGRIERDDWVGQAKKLASGD